MRASFPLGEARFRDIFTNSADAESSERLCWSGPTFFILSDLLGAEKSILDLKKLLLYRAYF